MVDHIIKKHVTLRVAPAIKAPEQRVIGDMTGWGRDAADLRQDEQGPFLRAVAQWREEAPSKSESPRRPIRDQELLS